MKQKEMIELVRAHHPHLGEVEIRKFLNRSMRNLTGQVNLVDKFFTLTSVAGQRLYEVDDTMTKIKDVQIADSDGILHSISRTLDRPYDDDEV